MAKNKDKKQVINNIQELNLEIDYDKLAEAMVTAQENHKRKINAKKSLREKAMFYLNGTLYAAVYIISGFCIYLSWTKYNQESMELFFAILNTVIFSFIGVYAFLCQQEAFGDDAQTVQTHFNTNIALAALIISAIALFKGVG